MDGALLGLLADLAQFGDENDSHETARSRRMLNITPETGRLLWILVRAMGAARVLEVGTSNAYSTIWLASGVRPRGGKVTTLEQDTEKIAMARANLARAGNGEEVSVKLSS